MWILSNYITAVSGPWELYTNKLLNYYFCMIKFIKFYKKFFENSRINKSKITKVNIKNIVPLGNYGRTYIGVYVSVIFISDKFHGMSSKK